MVAIVRELEVASTANASPAPSATTTTNVDEVVPSLQLAKHPVRRHRVLTPLQRCGAVLGCVGLISLVVTIAIIASRSHTEQSWLPSFDGVTFGPDYYKAAPLSLPLPSNTTVLHTFAHGSCADQRKPQRFWPTVQSVLPQLFLFNGDIVYGDCHGSGCPELPAAWRALFGNSNFASASEVLPMTGILDDHDYGMNDAYVSNPFKAFAKAIFLERFGMGAADERRTRDGLYTALTFGPYGRRTQLLMLDTRWSRSPFMRSGCRHFDECPGFERYVAYNESASAEHTILGDAQWVWLEEKLKEPADVRFLVSTIQVLAIDHGWERWGLIPTEVTRLMRLIGSTKANGVILLSGDRHVGGVYRLPKGENEAPYDLVEVTASSLTHSFRGGRAEEAGRMRDGPLIHENNFGTVHLDWTAGIVTLDLRASDNCGLARQDWGQLCDLPHVGTAGAQLRVINVSLAQLVV